jgi:MFS family permease
MSASASAAASPVERKAPLAPWYIVEFANSFACTLLTAGAYDYATDVLHASPSHRLWLSAFWGFTYIFIALAAGKFSEKVGPRRSVLMMSLGCTATAFIGLLAIRYPSVWMLGAVMLPYNFTSTMIWPAVESALTRAPGKLRLTSRMSLYNISWGSAGFVAFFTRGALEHASWSLIFLAPAGASLLGFLVLLLFAPNIDLRHKPHVADDPDAAHELDSPAVRARARTLLHMAWIGNALAYVAINVLIPVMLRLASEAGTTDLAAAGALTSIWSFTRFAGFAAVWLWTGWHYKARWLLAAQVALAASFLALFTIHSGAILLPAQILFGLSAALVYSSALYYAMHVSSGHGGHAGFHEALIGMGICLGPTIGALAGAGDIGRPALHRIGVGVTIVLLAGTAAMIWLALKPAAHTMPPSSAPESPA